MDHLRLNWKVTNAIRNSFLRGFFIAVGSFLILFRLSLRHGGYPSAPRSGELCGAFPSLQPFGSKKIGDVLKANHWPLKIS